MDPASEFKLSHFLIQNWQFRNILMNIKWEKKHFATARLIYFMQIGPKSWDEGWTRLSGHIGGVWAFRTTSRKRFPAAYTQPLSLVLCKAAANCGAPQIVQHFVGFKYMISLYLLLKNNLMASELLSNFWTEFRLMNFSLLRNLKITQQLDSSFLKKLVL